MSVRAEKTINYCSCMPSFNYTTPAGKLVVEEHGGCIRSVPQELPWCFVIAATCVAPPENQKRGLYWDTCLSNGVQVLPAGAWGCICTGAAERTRPVHAPCQAQRWTCAQCWLRVVACRHV